MSIKIAIMAFRAIEARGIKRGVTATDLIEADMTKRLQFDSKDQLAQNIQAAALKCSWSRNRRTGKYDKF